MVVTAGTADNFNSMTASWEQWGMCGRVPAAFITIGIQGIHISSCAIAMNFTLCFFDEEDTVRL